MFNDLINDIGTGTKVGIALGATLLMAVPVITKIFGWW